MHQRTPPARNYPRLAMADKFENHQNTVIIKCDILLIFQPNWTFLIEFDFHRKISDIRAYGHFKVHVGRYNFSL